MGVEIRLDTPVDDLKGNDGRAASTRPFLAVGAYAERPGYTDQRQHTCYRGDITLLRDVELEQTRYLKGRVVVTAAAIPPWMWRVQ